MHGGVPPGILFSLLSLRRRWLLTIFPKDGDPGLCKLHCSWSLRIFGCPEFDYKPTPPSVEDKPEWRLPPEAERRYRHPPNQRYRDPSDSSSGSMQSIVDNLNRAIGKFNGAKPNYKFLPSTPMWHGSPPFLKPI